MRAVEYLDREKILYYWVYYFIDEHGSKQFINYRDDHFLYPDGKRSPTHFRLNVPLVERQMKYFHENRENIFTLANEKKCFVGLMVSTFQIRQIDIDDETFLVEVEHLKEQLPYYLSVRKQLPHFFFKTDFTFRTQSSTSYEHHMMDILHGTCGLIHPDQFIYNANKSLDFDFDNFIINYIPDVKPKTHVHSDGQKLVFTTDETIENIVRLIKFLDDSRATAYHSWITFGLLFKNWNSGEDGFKLFQYFSTKGSNYKEDEWTEYGRCTKKWEELKPNGSIGLGSLYYYARLDNPEEYDKYFGQTYYRKKKEFEYCHFKSGHLYYIENEDGTITELTSEKFTERYRNIWCYVAQKNKKGKEEIKYVKFIHQWMDDSAIRTYKQLVFKPDHDVPKDVYNLFKGFHVYRKCKDLIYDHEKGQYGLELFQNHIRLLSGLDKTEEVYQYIIKYMAHMIQRPSRKIGLGLLFKSMQGAGKSITFEFLIFCIIGLQYSVTIRTEKQLFGDFNAHLLHKLIAIYEEANGKDTFANADRLKNLLNQPWINIESKGKDTMNNVPDYTNYIFFSNNLTPVKKEAGDRKYFCIRCNDSMKCNRPYFDKLNTIFDFKNKYENPCLHSVWAIFQWLLSIDISTFDVENDRPATSFNEEMISYDAVLLFLNDMMKHEIQKGNDVVYISKKHLYEAYINWHTEKYGNSDRHVENEDKFGKKVNDYKKENSGFITPKKIKGIRYILYSAKDLYDKFATLKQEQDDNEEDYS